MKTNFHNKNFALSHAFIMRFKATRRWPIVSLPPVAPSKAPTNFRVLPLTSSRVHASWQLPPADSTHGANIGFKLLYRKSFGAGPVTVKTINDNSSVSIDVTGLEKFTEYEFQLLAFSSVGNGPKTSLQVVKTNEDGKMAI